MLINKNQAIVSGLLGLSVVGLATATALQFNDRIEYRIGNKIESAPSWLVPPKAEFKRLERGYGGIKILLALLVTGGMVTVMLIARKEGEQEPIRQRIKGYQQKAYEFDFAAESAYQMAATQQRYKTLLEADDVAFQGEIEAAYCESLGIDPRQQQPALTGTTTLDSVANPSDKVEASTAAAIEPGLTDSPKMPNLTNYPSVLIYGAQGAGKTYFAEQEIKRRRNAGHKVIALDPHAGYSSWQGCEVIGAGMNYEAIDVQLALFATKVKERYESIRKEPNPNFEPLTFVCDEFTNWASRCKTSGDFFQTALSDIRKTKMFVLFVSHARTLKGLGNAAGMADTRDAALLEIEMLGQLDPDTGEATPRFEAMVKLPGTPLSDRTLVKLTRHNPLTTSESTPKPNLSHSEYLERAYDLEFDFGLKKQSDSLPDIDDLSGGHPQHPPDTDKNNPNCGQLESLADNVSDVIWTVRLCHKLYPDVTPEQLFESVSVSARRGENVRNIIKSVLKCREGSEHPTRSYSGHGKTLLRWLIDNYDNGEVASFPGIKNFLEDSK
jgi:hypothetical protein